MAQLQSLRFLLLTIDPAVRIAYDRYIDDEDGFDEAQDRLKARSKYKERPDKVSDEIFRHCSSLEELHLWKRADCWHDGARFRDHVFKVTVDEEGHRCLKAEGVLPFNDDSSVPDLIPA